MLLNCRHSQTVIASKYFSITRMLGGIFSSLQVAGKKSPRMSVRVCG